MYNYNTLKQLGEIYKIPNKILKEDVNVVNEKDTYTIEYKYSNMIDFLGKYIPDYTELPSYEELEYNVYQELEKEDQKRNSTY